MICARVAGVPSPFSLIASRSSSSSTSLPAPSIALSNVASVKRGGGLVCVGLDLDLGRLHRLVRLHRHEAGRVVRLRFLAIDRQPARVDHHLAFALERLAFDPRDARGHQEFRRRIEHRQEALRHQVVELRLRLAQVLGRERGRDDREVIGDFRVVEDALVGPHPAALQNLVRRTCRSWSASSIPSVFFTVSR